MRAKDLKVGMNIRLGGISHFWNNTVIKILEIMEDGSVRSQVIKVNGSNPYFEIGRIDIDSLATLDTFELYLEPILKRDIPWL